VDRKQEIFFRNPEQNMSKVPFYMAYPMQTVYMEELEYARDLEKLKGMYPKEVRSIQEMVEDECDKMEYEGSLMFDEYPDRVMISQIVKRIYDTATEGQKDIQKFEVEQSDMGLYEREQYEEGAYQEADMQAEEIPLEGNLVAQRGPGWGPGRPPGPGWGPGRPPGPPPGPGWGPGRPPGPPPGPGWGPGRPPGPPKNNGLNNLIEVLLFNEMYQRRCRHRRCRRWW